jgi:hypothetical protein
MCVAECSLDVDHVLVAGNREFESFAQEFGRTRAVASIWPCEYVLSGLRGHDCERQDTVPVFVILRPFEGTDGPTTEDFGPYVYAETV